MFETLSERDSKHRCYALLHDNAVKHSENKDAGKDLKFWHCILRRFKQLNAQPIFHLLVYFCKISSSSV